MSTDEANPLPPTIRELAGSEPLRLERQDAAWVVESGRVALFAVTPGPDGAHGPRRFCFEVERGGVLFGFPTSSRVAIVAVGLEPAVLRRLSPGASGSLPLEAWREAWEKVVCGLEPAPGGLEELQRGVLERLDELERTEQAAARERIAGEARQAEQRAAQAVGELAAVLDPGRDALPRGTPLFVAAAATARASGITLSAPRAWEERRGLGGPVERIAAASHVRAREVLLDGAWWRADAGPLLGFMADDERPVALLPRSPSRYELFDPASGERSAVDRALASRLATRAYTFYRPLPGDATTGIGLLRFALRGRSGDIALTLLSAVAAALLGMLTPLATGLLVDHAIPDADVELLWQLGAALGGATLGAAVFRLSQGIALTRLETGADTATQAAVWDRLLALELSFFRRYSTGDLQSRVSAVGEMRSLLGGTTLRSLFAAVVLLLNLGLLVHYSALLALVALGVALLAAAVSILAGWGQVRLSRRIQELRGRFFGFMVQLIHGVAKLRVAAAEERAFALWAKQYAELLRLELRQRRIGDGQQVATIAVTAASTIALFAGAAALVRPAAGDAALSIGSFVAFSVAYGTFIGAVTTLSEAVVNVMSSRILRERARPILEGRAEVDERRADPGELAGRIRLDRVSFAYRDDGPIILDEVELTIEPGSFVALVGPSGSGKSTLFRLLLGFESPRSGTILYDGQDLAGLDVQAVRRQMGVVLQYGRINAGSLFENIASGTRVSLGDAWEAARAAGFAEEVQAMPMGMHTVISEGGTNLSGGQRQRLLIARALVHRPRILLLDEATSALDNRTQAVVSESLRQLAVTRVVIAHRLSTIREAHRIFVIDSGRIAQSGTFEELAAQQGLFARLMARQLA